MNGGSLGIKFPNFVGYRLYKLTREMAHKFINAASMTYYYKDDGIVPLTINAYIPASGTSSYAGTSLGCFYLRETEVKIGQSGSDNVVVYGKPKVS